MNTEGFDYIKEINSKFKKNFKTYYTDSDIKERMMRCGQEARRFEIALPEETEYLEQVAIATLKEDLLYA